MGEALKGSSLSGIGGELRPGIVHRIDRDTSGLIIAAKNDAAHQALSAQLQDHTLARTYEAVVVGNLREDRGTVDAPIGRHHTDRKKMAVTDRGGRRAVTHWEVLGRNLYSQPSDAVRTAMNAGSYFRSFSSRATNSSFRGQDSSTASPVLGWINRSPTAWRHWPVRPGAGFLAP